MNSKEELLEKKLLEKKLLEKKLLEKKLLEKKLVECGFAAAQCGKAPPFRGVHLYDFEAMPRNWRHSLQLFL